MATIDKKQCLLKALRASQILKRRSFADWPEMVDMVSTQMGMPMKVEYVQNDKQEVIGINYLVPTDKLGESPLETGIEYLANQQAWLSDEDRSWGMNYHNQLTQGNSLTSNDAKDIFSKLVKYRERLEQGGIHLPVNYSGLAHHYDSSIAPRQVFEGQLLGSPFGDPRELKSALSQKPQPLQVSKNLLMLGEMGVKIGHSFQNRNRDLDGLDVLSSTASLAGASLIVLGLISEHLSKSEAKKFDPDNLLKELAAQLDDLASQFDELDSQARPILQARQNQSLSSEETPGDDSLYIILEKQPVDLEYPPIQFTGDTRQDLAQIARNIRLRQSLLIQALDSHRMPMPLTVSGTNESLKEAIDFLTKANHELLELVEEKIEQEQPILTVDGAITASALFNQVKDFFCAREKTEQRLFNSQLEYQLTAKNLGLKIFWNADNFQVFSDSYDLVCHIQRKEKDFVVLTEPSPELATILTHFPTSEEDIRQFISQSNLLTFLQDIAPDYCGKQLKFQIPVGNSYQEFCTFDFHPDRITAHNPQQKLIWENRGNEVVINQFSVNHLEKLVSFLSRPFSTVSTVSNSQEAHQAMEPNGFSFS